MEKAALLVAEDLLTDHEIASECGISNRTLYRWKKREEFIARVNTMVQAYSARVLGSGIASRVRRVETLKLLPDKMLSVSTRCTRLGIPLPSARAEYAYNISLTRAIKSSPFFFHL